jgi:hypothetical protein
MQWRKVACPVSLYSVSVEYGLEELRDRLRNFSLFRSEVEFLGKKFQLGLKVEKIEDRQGSLSCIIADTFLSAVKVNDEILKLPATRRVMLSFIKLGADVYLLVFARKREADQLVSMLSEELFKKPDAVYGLVVPSAALSKIYHAENVEVKQVVYESTSDEEEVKTTVYFGRNLASVLSRGERERKHRIKYMLYRDEYGVFGISMHGTVVCFTQLPQEELISYIVERILPLAEPSG